MLNTTEDVIHSGNDHPRGISVQSFRTTLCEWWRRR